MRTVVCDDELPALELLTALLAKAGDVEITLSTQSVVDALHHVNKHGADLLVLDIDMPGFTGVEAAGVMTADPKPLIVFATAHPEFALDAFGVDAIDYMLKPLSPGRVAQAVAKASRMHKLIKDSEAQDEIKEAPAEEQSPRREVLRVKDFGHVYFVPYGDVTSIEAAGDYSLLHSKDRDYAMRKTIRALEDELPDDQFMGL